MSVFEYLMVMTSVVLALALAQLLRGATEIFLSPKAYFAHGTWLVTIIFMIIQMWWAFWDFNGIANWTFLAFLYVLSVPIGIFVAAHLLVPASRSNDFDWRSHFFTVRAWFFLAMIATVVLAVTLSWSLLEASLLHPYRVFQGTLLLLLVAGLVSARPRFQEILAVTFLIVFGASQVVVRMNLGALAERA